MENLLALPQGTELAGDYRITRVLGAGGFGITYLAEETSLHRGVAIKEYFPSDFAAREGTTLVRHKSQSLEEDYRWGLDRFIEEAQALAKFDHANIVRVYRYFRQNNTGYMVLKLEEGRSFKAWLDQLGRRPRQAELDAIIAPLLDALELIHSRSFLHRDIAPDNIMIRPDGTPVLIDFGSARRDVASLTNTMSVLVKPGYSPVEQYAEAGKRQGPWSDIYALAATLYHAVAGKRPPDAPARMQQDDMVPAVDAAQGSFRRTFLQAIDKALSLPIDLRPQTIGEWRPDLLGAAALASVAAEAPRPVPPPAAASAQTRKIEGDEPALIRFPKRKAEAKAAQPADAKPTQPKVGPLERARAVAGGMRRKAGAVLQRLRAKSRGFVPAATEIQPARKPRSLRSLLEQASRSVEPTGLLSPDASDAPTALVKPKVATPAPAQLPAKVAKTPPVAKPAKPRERRIAVSPGRMRAFAGRMLVRLAMVSVIVAGAATIERWGPKVGLVMGSSAVSTVTDVSLIRTLRGHKVPVEAMAVSSDGKLIASGGSDGQLIVWDAASGSQLRSILAPDTQLTSLSISEHVALAGAVDGSVTLWQLDTGTRLGQYDEHDGPVWAVAFLGTARQFVTAGQDTRVRVWDGGRVRSVWYDHKRSVLAVASAPRAHLVATGGSDKLVKLWDDRRRRLLRTLEGHTGDVRAVALSPDGSLVASASNDGTVIVWSASDGTRLATLEGHGNRVVSVAFSPDGRMLASGSEDGIVKLWDAASGKLLNSYEGHVMPVRAVAFLGDGHALASAGDDQTVRLWNARIAGYP